MRMQQFKNNMKEIQQNVRKAEESLGILNTNSRNAGGKAAKSPT